MILADLVSRAEGLAERGRSARRCLLGLTGAPGSGKSTLAAALSSRLGPCVRVVGMDGFHLARTELVRLGRLDRKGAPDTFDASGFVALLRRLRDNAGDNAGEVVYAPRFDRALEEPIACAVPVGQEVALVIVEGNYLLLDAPPWDEVRPLLDECWYLDPGDQVRQARLVARHEHYGRSPDQARERALGSDERNAQLIAAFRDRADLTVNTLEGLC